MAGSVDREAVRVIDMRGVVRADRRRAWRADRFERGSIHLKDLHLMGGAEVADVNAAGVVGRQHAGVLQAF